MMFIVLYHHSVLDLPDRLKLRASISKGHPTEVYTNVNTVIGLLTYAVITHCNL